MYMLFGSVVLKKMKIPPIFSLGNFSELLTHDIIEPGSMNRSKHNRKGAISMYVCLSGASYLRPACASGNSNLARLRGTVGYNAIL